MEVNFPSQEGFIITVAPSFSSKGKQVFTDKEATKGDVQPTQDKSAKERDNTNGKGVASSLSAENMAKVENNQPQIKINTALDFKQKAWKQKKRKEVSKTYTGLKDGMVKWTKIENYNKKGDDLETRIFSGRSDNLIKEECYRTFDSYIMINTYSSGRLDGLEKEEKGIGYYCKQFFSGRKDDLVEQEIGTALTRVYSYSDSADGLVRKEECTAYRMVEEKDKSGKIIGEKLTPSTPYYTTLEYKGRDDGLGKLVKTYEGRTPVKEERTYSRNPDGLTNSVINKDFHYERSYDKEGKCTEKLVIDGRTETLKYEGRDDGLVNSVKTYKGDKPGKLLSEVKTYSGNPDGLTKSEKTYDENNLSREIQTYSGNPDGLTEVEITTDGDKQEIHKKYSGRPDGLKEEIVTQEKGKQQTEKWFANNPDKSYEKIDFDGVTMTIKTMDDGVQLKSYTGRKDGVVYEKVGEDGNTFESKTVNKNANGDTSVIFSIKDGTTVVSTYDKNGKFVNVGNFKLADQGINEEENSLLPIPDSIKNQINGPSFNSKTMNLTESSIKASGKKISDFLNNYAKLDIPPKWATPINAVLEKMNKSKMDFKNSLFKDLMDEWNMDKKELSRIAKMAFAQYLSSKDPSSLTVEDVIMAQRAYTDLTDTKELKKFILDVESHIMKGL